MQRVDTILAGGVVLTMNEALDIYPRGAVAIKGDFYCCRRASQEIQHNYTADELIYAKGQVYHAGMVNTHTHVPTTLLRGLADDLRLHVWLMGYVMPTEGQFVNPEFAGWGRYWPVQR